MFLFQHSGSKESGQVENVTLRLFGTREMPEYMRNSEGHRRQYNYQLEDIVRKKYVSVNRIINYLPFIFGRPRPVVNV